VPGKKMPPQAEKNMPKDPEAGSTKKPRASGMSSDITHLCMSITVFVSTQFCTLPRREPG
jgi:hypothetical protein